MRVACGGARRRLDGAVGITDHPAGAERLVARVGSGRVHQNRDQDHQHQHHGHAEDAGRDRARSRAQPGQRRALLALRFARYLTPASARSDIFNLDESARALKMRNHDLIMRKSRERDQKRVRRAHHISSE